VLIALTDSHGVIANGFNGCTVVHRSLHELAVITDLLFRQWATGICLWCDTLTLFEHFDQASWKNFWQIYLVVVHYDSSYNHSHQNASRPVPPRNVLLWVLLTFALHLTFSMPRKMANPIFNFEINIAYWTVP